MPLTISSDEVLVDEPWLFKVSTDSDWIVAPDTEYGMLAPGYTLRIPLNAKPCQSPGERTGSITVRHEQVSKSLPIRSTCVQPTDVVFGNVDAYQSVKIGATEWKPASEVPIISGKPGAIRAEVQAHFVPEGGHIEVEALVLDRNNRPHPTLSPLKYLREPYDDSYSTLRYKAIHEFKAPAAVFGEYVRVVLNLDPNKRLSGDEPANNKARPLENAPRLPKGYPLAPFRFNLTAVTMTIVKDGQEYVLKGEIPDCPNGCMTPALDWLPINRERVQIRTHELVIEEPIEYNVDGVDGTHAAIRRATYEAAKAQGIVDENWDMNRKTIVAIYEDFAQVGWANGFAGLSGNTVTTIVRTGRKGEELDVGSIIAHLGEPRRLHSPRYAKPYSKFHGLWD